jgi:hypothetical protein
VRHLPEETAEGEAEQHGRSSVVMTGGRYRWKGGETETERLIVPSIIEAERHGTTKRCGHGGLKRRPDTNGDGFLC